MEKIPAALVWLLCVRELVAALRVGGMLSVAGCMFTWSAPFRRWAKSIQGQLLGKHGVSFVGINRIRIYSSVFAQDMAEAKSLEFLTTVLDKRPQRYTSFGQWPVRGSFGGSEFRCTTNALAPPLQSLPYGGFSVIRVGFGEGARDKDMLYKAPWMEVPAKTLEHPDNAKTGAILNIL